MDKEAQEKIEALLSQYSSELLAWKSWGMDAVEKTHDLKTQIAQEIVQVLLPKGKPPLLTIDEARPYCKTAKTHYALGWTDTYVWDALGLLKAQRELDIKHYEN